MAITLEDTSRNASVDARVDQIDVGAGANGQVKIIDQDGTTVLCTVDLPNPCFGDSAAGTATANAISDATASASGTATTYEVFDADGNKLWSGTITATGGGGDMTITNTNIANGDTVSIDSWTHSQPAS